MAIPYANIKSDISATLDSEGNDRYLDVLDFIPAINKAQDYCLGLIMPHFGSKKFNSEQLKGLIATRIFQPSIYSRIYVDAVLSTWGIISVYVNPVVAIPPSSSTTYTAAVVPSADQSLLRANLIYVSGGTSCRRLNSQEWTGNASNPLLDGYVPVEANPINLNYAYLSHIDNESAINPAMPYEITIRPFIDKNTPVAITYVKYPTRVTSTSSVLDWSPVFQQLLVKASTKFILEKDGAAAKDIYTITEKDITDLVLLQG